MTGDVRAVAEVDTRYIYHHLMTGDVRAVAEVDTRYIYHHLMTGDVRAVAEVDTYHWGHSDLVDTVVIAADHPYPSSTCRH